MLRVIDLFKPVVNSINLMDGWASAARDAALITVRASVSIARLGTPLRHERLRFIAAVFPDQVLVPPKPGLDGV